jgi:hypothetical protein
VKKLSELRKTAPVSEPRQQQNTRNYWDEEPHAAVPCWSRTSDDAKSSFRVRHICKLCKRHDLQDGCYRLINGSHAWVCDECYAAQPWTGGGTFLDTAEGAIPLALKPRFERKADGHIGAVGGE